MSVNHVGAGAVAAAASSEDVPGTAQAGKLRPVRLVQLLRCLDALSRTLPTVQLDLSQERKQKQTHAAQD